MQRVVAKHQRPDSPSYVIYMLGHTQVILSEYKASFDKYMYLFKTCSYRELQENIMLAKVKSSPTLNNCFYGFPSITLNLCSVKIEFVLRAPRQGTLSDVWSTMIIALSLRDRDVRSQRYDRQSRRYSSTNITIFNKTVLERALYSHQRKYMQFELQCTYMFKHLRWPFKFE